MKNQTYFEKFMFNLPIQFVLLIPKGLYSSKEMIGRRRLIFWSRWIGINIWQWLFIHILLHQIKKDFKDGMYYGKNIIFLFGMVRRENRVRRINSTLNQQHFLKAQM